MARKQQTKGDCVFCGKTMSKGGVSKHLKSCRTRQTAISDAKSRKIKPETLYHLRVQDAYGGDYWLNLEMRGTKTLGHLDNYLRAIWLECCGHMSQFMVGQFEDGFGKTRKVDAVFSHTSQLEHVYDFGTSSETLVKLVDIREGKPLTAKPIYLMARNHPIETNCIECDQPATHLCMECIYEDNSEGTLCDEHAEAHPHDNYGEPMPIVNSPRIGMCGYTGPANPPY